MTFDVDQLLAELSVDEKVKLLSLKDFWHTANIDRLSIPSIRLSDGPNGIRGTKFFNGVKSACFTSGTGLGSTFNPEILEQAGKLMAVEAKHKGAHVILGPTCNIQRGPLGGRGFESFSEDPYLSGIASASVIRGIESEGIAATIKHYVANDLEDERNSIDAIVSERALREVYLLPFQLAMKYGAPRCVMSSYNKVNGEHVSQSPFLLNEVLREEWGWDGLIMSDWFGVYSVKASIDAGLDLECPGYPRMRKHDLVMHAITAREISTDVIDERVRNVLNLVKSALKTGIPENAPEDTLNNTPETSAFVRKLATEAIVLLKNEDSFLPLSKSDSVAVIGPNAKIGRIFGGGSASMKTYYSTDVYSGVAAKLTEKPAYSLGCSIDRELVDLGALSTYGGSAGVLAKVYKEPVGTANRTLIEELTLDSTKLILFDYTHPDLEGSPLFFLDLEGEFTAPEDGEYDVKIRCLGTALLYVNDKLLIDDKTHQELGAGAIGACSKGDTKSVALKKGESFKYRVEFGSGPTFTLKTMDLVGSNGGGTLDVSIMKHESPEVSLKNAVEVAKTVDKVILCTGTSADWESEGYDRSSMDLPMNQDELVEAILAVNKNVVVVNLSGTPVTMPWVDSVPALVQGWFNGMESGNAVADVLFGDVNPSGKLSLTFPKRVEDNPAFLTFKSNNGKCVYGEDVFVGHRYYEMVKRDAMFAFGYGLSYTSFELSGLSVELDGEDVVASLTVKNTGSVGGHEVVQMYVAPPKTTTAVLRPLKEFKGFKKVFLEAGESQKVKIDVPIRYAGSYFDAEKRKWALEKGDYTVLVGNSSDSKVFLEGGFTVKKGEWWKGL